MLVRILKAWYKLFLVVHIAVPPSAGGLSSGNFYIRGTKTMRELSLSLMKAAIKVLLPDTICSPSYYMSNPIESPARFRPMSRP